MTFKNVHALVLPGVSTAYLLIKLYSLNWGWCSSSILVNWIRETEIWAERLGTDIVAYHLHSGATKRSVSAWFGPNLHYVQQATSKCSIFIIYLTFYTSACVVNHSNPRSGNNSFSAIVQSSSLKRWQTLHLGNVNTSVGGRKRSDKRPLLSFLLRGHSGLHPWKSRKKKQFLGSASATRQSISPARRQGWGATLRSLSTAASLTKPPRFVLLHWGCHLRGLCSPLPPLLPSFLTPSHSLPH